MIRTIVICGAAALAIAAQPATATAPVKDQRARALVAALDQRVADLEQRISDLEGIDLPTVECVDLATGFECDDPNATGADGYLCTEGGGAVFDCAEIGLAPTVRRDK